MADPTPVEKQLMDQMLVDNSVVNKVQNHDFIALTSQSRSISARLGQQMEKQVVEFDYAESLAMRPFDPNSSSFLLQKDRVNNNGITVNEQFLMALLAANPK